MSKTIKVGVLLIDGKTYSKVFTMGCNLVGYYEWYEHVDYFFGLREKLVLVRSQSKTSWLNRHLKEIKTAHDEKEKNEDEAMTI